MGTFFLYQRTSNDLLCFQNIEQVELEKVLSKEKEPCLLFTLRSDSVEWRGLSASRLTLAIRLTPSYYLKEQFDQLLHLAHFDNSYQEHYIPEKELLTGWAVKIIQRLKELEAPKEIPL